MIYRWKTICYAAAVLLLGATVSACRKQEQAVVGVAQNAAQSAQKVAVNAAANAKQVELKVQSAAAESATERAALQHIPLPTKSLYVNIHEPGQWQNPFLTVDANRIDLHVVMVDANTSPIGAGTMLRPEGARKQELQIRQADLAKALIALPDGAWRYGRVVAIAESPEAARKDRPAIRRNVEAAIQKLNDMGIVVEEWPSR